MVLDECAVSDSSVHVEVVGGCAWQATGFCFCVVTELDEEDEDEFEIAAALDTADEVTTSEAASEAAEAAEVNMEFISGNDGTVIVIVDSSEGES